MNIDGNGKINLSNNIADDYSPVFSPDGSKIAFMSRRDGNPEIYIMNADGSGQMNLSNNAAVERIQYSVPMAVRSLHVKA
jgi:TolB protein